MKISHTLILKSENGMRKPLSKKNLRDPKYFFFFFGCFCRRFCHADVDSRAQQAILLKKVEKSRRSRLSRTSRATSRLIRPRPIDCDAGHDRQTKTIPVLANYFFEHRQKSFYFVPAI